MTESTKKNQLKGRENFLPWSTRLETLLTLDDVVTRNEATDKLEIKGLLPADKEANEKVAKKYVIQNCDDSVMHSINPGDDFIKIMDKLNAAYGFGNMDPSIILNKLRDIRFHPSKDPSVVLNEIDLRLAELESAGGSITDAQMVQYIHDGLSGDALRDNFWFNCKGAMSMKKLSTYTVESAGQYIVQFWYSYKPKQLAETSNFTEKKKGKFEKRFCQHCSENKRERIMKTHNSCDCRFQSSSEGNVDPATTNKATANYSSIDSEDIYHDSGTSITMVKFVPDDITETNLKIPVFTAGADQPPEFGIAKGTLKFGGININALQVPKFAKNLLSATQLSLEHGCTQTIDPWTAKLTVSKDDKVIATGTYDESSKLIKIDPVLPETSNLSNADDWTTVHKKLGHAGSAMIRKTLKASTGITLKNNFSVLDCEDCKIAKAKRNPISPGNATNLKEILDVIEIDVQGPFPVIANDGTCYNLKLIDSKSGWLYYTTIPNARANTILDHFLKYKARVEKQTGREIKRVRTDQGTEFMGEFLSYLEISGIVKEKGVAYTHHHPGKVERSHQTILRLARAMLKDSLLPPKYYDEAQRCAAYVFNRTIHGSDVKTPYEHIFDRKPDLSNLQPFGSVCYAFISPEKRTKLDDSAIKCRLIGYGDDFELEEIKGYKLLKEDDGTIIWSDNCIFDKDLKMERLPEIFYSTQDKAVEDELWINDSISEVGSEAPDDIFYDAEEDLTENETANLVSHMLENRWWTEKDDYSYDEFNVALKSVMVGIPTTFKQAMESKEKDSWLQAMELEMKNIRDNHTYEIKRIKDGESAIGCRWVFKKKLNKDGSVDKFKARLVAKGYLQQYGRDYNETFAPVAKFKSIRLLLAIAAQRGQKVYHDDVTSAFLNGVLKEEVLMDQPDGFQELSSMHKWRLRKTLYGLKQSPREWNEAIHNFLVSQGFLQSKCDPCLYFKKTDSYEILTGIYVDDVISTGTNDIEVQKFRKALKSKFKCSEGGILEWCLGMEVQQSADGIRLNQKQYVTQKLEEFKDHLKPNIQRTVPLDPNFQQLLIDADASGETDDGFPYRSVVGSLMYAATGSRPDITTAVGIASRYLSKPKAIHCEMVRQILYYLRQYPDYSLHYKKSLHPLIEGYCDASWANNEDYSSISGFAFTFGKSLISWSSRKQPVIALSSTEAEYVSVTSGAQEALWFSNLLNELGLNQHTVTIHEDNEACINLTKNPQEYKRTRHIQVKYHFIRSLVKAGKIALKYCNTKVQLADIFTKGVNAPRLKEICSKLGLIDSSKQERELNIALMSACGCLHGYPSHGYPRHIHVNNTMV